jgi:hypothetical protein
MIAACSGAANGPTSPSAAAGGEVAAAPDGSTLKTPAPRIVSPTGGASAAATPTLVAEPTVGRFSTLVVRTARFQLSESSAFTTITDEGTATGAVNGLITYTVQRAQGAGRRIYWRTRAELDGAVSPWSVTAEFVVSGTATPTPTPSPGGGNRTPNPPAVSARCPMRGLIAQWTSERPDLFPSQQCPLGVSYVNNPWQDYIMDRLRQLDTRWGYNAKPTYRADNGGRPAWPRVTKCLQLRLEPDQGNTNEVRRGHPRAALRHATSHAARVHRRRAGVLDRRRALLGARGSGRRYGRC